MDIPWDVRIKSTIRAGSVYYYADDSQETSTDPHYFVVLNANPLTDEVVILIHCSSKLENVRRRTAKYPGTLVEVTQSEYNTFTEPISAFNGNSVAVRNVSELINKLTSKQLIQKPEMSDYILEKLRNAVLASPAVERKYKSMIFSKDKVKAD